MANWQMEVGRMMLYILFPVSMFHYTNRIENMDEWLYNQKEKCLPGDDKKHKEFLKMIDNYNSEIRLQQLEQMEQQFSNMKPKHLANV